MFQDVYAWLQALDIGTGSCAGFHTGFFYGRGGHVVLCRWLHDEGNYKGSKLPLQEVLHV